MRAFIRWIFFEGDSIRKLIKNDENNENWPNARRFSIILKDWQYKINNQQKEINKIEIKNLKTRQLMADVQTWFINEHNLLGKPAKRAWLEKQGELRRLEREVKAFQYNLDHPKQELEEYEKVCLLKKIEIGKRRIGNCKDELKDAEKAFENEKKELCLRLTYTREESEPFLYNDEQNPTKIEVYSKWWKKYHNIHQSNTEDDTPLNKLRSCIAKWETHNEGKAPEPNPYEIWVEEKTNDGIVFLWKPVERELETINEKMERVKVKGQYLSLCKNYLFNYYGEWYEVTDYYQTNYTTVEITASRSIFYNDYWGLLRSQANLILHHSTMGNNEICSCPGYEVYTSKNKFALEYELKFDLFKLGSEQKHNKWYIGDGSISVIGGACPVIVYDIDEEWKKMISNWTAIKEGVIGSSETLYFLLSKRLYEKTKVLGQRRCGIWTSSFFLCPNKEESKSGSEKIPKIHFKRIGEFDKDAKISRLRNKTLDDFLEEKGLWKNEMYHFRRTHIKAVLYWREMKIWEGNYWDLRNEGMIVESVSPSGNCVTFMGGGRVLAKVIELVMVKAGVDANGMLSIIITTATTVASAYAGNYAGAAAAANVAGKAAKQTAKSIGATHARAAAGAVGGMAHLAHNELMNTPNYSESTQTMTFHEFRHKYLFSKDRPISLWVEYNQELANQYLNKRELKGPMFYNYVNLDFLGRVLAQKDFFKASVISWNMTKNSEWFRGRIESGIYLNDTDYQDFYKKKLSESLVATNEGGIILGDWNEFTVIGGTGEQILITSDITNADYSSADYIGSTDRNLWNQMAGQLNGSHHQDNEKVNAAFVGQHWCLGCLCGGGSHGSPNYSYSSTMNLTVGGTITLKTRASGPQTATIPSGGGKVIFEAKGNTAWIKLIGEKPETIKNPSGVPDGIPPSKQLPTDPNDANNPPTTPFNPNQFSQSGNLTPNPTGSGETEVTVPEIDVAPDPDFAQDPDTGIDPESDPTQDPDPGKDPEIPPDYDPSRPEDD